MREITVKLYQFNELSDAAKEKARDWFRSLQDSNDFEHVIEDAVLMGERLGITFTTHTVRLMGGGTRHDPNVWWSLGYTSSDGASFDGTWYWDENIVPVITKAAPADKDLHSIAQQFFDAKPAHASRISAVVRARNYFRQDIEVEAEDAEGNSVGIDEDTEKAVAEAVRDYNHWIYDRLRAEDEYQSSDEVVDETIRANEYEFYADGRRAV